jgi:hypothetical protein
MNKYKKLILILLTLVAISFTNNNRSLDTLNLSQIKHRLIEINILNNENPQLLESVVSLNEFLDRIGFLESSNNYKAKNKFGYIGKYQFHPTLIKNLGYNETKQGFLNNPQMQEEAMLTLLIHNKKLMKSHIKKYDNKVVNGILVTESGILASTHLAGPSNVKRWLDRGVRFKDGLGTSIRHYMETFEGYNLILE